MLKEVQVLFSDRSMKLHVKGGDITGCRAGSQCTIRCSDIFPSPLLWSSHHLSSIDPSGRVRPEIINESGNPSYKYFYVSAEQGIVPREEEGLAGSCVEYNWQEDKTEPFPSYVDTHGTANGWREPEGLRLMQIAPGFRPQFISQSGFDLFYFSITLILFFCKNPEEEEYKLR